MTFEKLSKLMFKELGTDKLSDIAMEFQVSPQVVSNWKSRNQVPYKYVKIFRSKINKKKIEPFSTAHLNTPSYFNLNEQEDDGDLIETFLLIYKNILKNWVTITIITFSFLIIGYIYINFIKTPLFLSKSKVIPISTQPSGAGIGQLAERFGVSLVGPAQSGSLSSAETFPDILKSRSLMYSLIFKTFDTKEYGKKQPLIKILLKKPDGPKVWKETHKKKAVSKLLRIINVNKKRNSPILTLTAITQEAEFSANLLVEVIDELMKRIRLHKLKNIQKTTSFIENRLKDFRNQLVEGEEKLKIFRERNRDIGSSPALLLEQERLIREISVTNSIYGSLKIEFEKSKIEESRFDTVLEILDPPEAPLNPFNVKINRTLIISFFLGIIISLSVVYFREFYIKEIKKRI